MATATQKKGRKAGRKDPVTPSRDEVIAKVREMGGEPEVKRYEQIEGLERTHGRGDVLHHWKIGSILGVSFREHDEEAIRVYSVGLQRAPQTLRLSVRLAALYKEPQVRTMLGDAEAAGHELNWAHFRQLLREGLTDVQRAELVPKIAEKRWGYRELQDVITGILGGKKSQGGRKPGQTKYKTYAQALSAMRQRSRAWLGLEEHWIDQVKSLASKLGEDEKLTPEFLAMTSAAAEQLRAVATKAIQDAEEAESLVNEVNKAMGNPDLEAVESAGPSTNGVHKAKDTPKPKAGTKVRVKAKRARLARHPKMVDGKFVGTE